MVWTETIRILHDWFRYLDNDVDTAARQEAGYYVLDCVQSLVQVILERFLFPFIIFSSS